MRGGGSVVLVDVVRVSMSVITPSSSSSESHSSTGWKRLSKYPLMDCGEGSAGGCAKELHG